MGLRRALDALPGDRDTQHSVREVLMALDRHRGEWMTASRIADAARVSGATAALVMASLASGRVVSEEDDRFCYTPDRLTRLDVEAFLRRAQVRTGMLQDNVERFRERYGR